jgi:hypothetical protein
VNLEFIELVGFDVRKSVVAKRRPERAVCDVGDQRPICHEASETTAKLTRTAEGDEGCAPLSEFGWIRVGIDDEWLAGSQATRDRLPGDVDQVRLAGACAL